MSVILHPANCSCSTCKPERDIAKIKSEKLQEAYQTEPLIKQLADKLHASRMLPPPTCEDCIERAIHMLAEATS